MIPLGTTSLGTYGRCPSSADYLIVHFDALNTLTVVVVNKPFALATRTGDDAEYVSSTNVKIESTA